MIIAREFNKNDKEQLMVMIKEIMEFDNNFDGLTNIKKCLELDFDEFLNYLERNKYQELINPDYSPQTTFGIFDNGKLIGGFNLRHVIKGQLINHGGNIGYLIRPSERRKGYGTKLLSLALEKAKNMHLNKVLVMCIKENIGSEKVIINNGGIYENDYFDSTTGNTFKRFWIEL